MLRLTTPSSLSRPVIPSYFLDSVVTRLQAAAAFALSRPKRTRTRKAAKAHGTSHPLTRVRTCWDKGQTVPCYSSTSSSIAHGLQLTCRSTASVLQVVPCAPSLCKSFRRATGCLWVPMQHPEIMATRSFGCRSVCIAWRGLQGSRGMRKRAAVSGLAARPKQQCERDATGLCLFPKRPHSFNHAFLNLHWKARRMCRGGWHHCRREYPQGASRKTRASTWTSGLPGPLCSDAARP